MLDILVEVPAVLAMVMQAVVVMMALGAYSHVPDRGSWRWFVLAGLAVFARRLTAVAERAMGFDTTLLENIETVLISCLWIVYIRKYTRPGRSGR